MKILFLHQNFPAQFKFLAPALIKEGYEEVFTEKLSMIEKILYFSNCTHVKGAIGGGISNVLFSPETTKLKAIISPTFLDVNKRFKFCLDVAISLRHL